MERRTSLQIRIMLSYYFLAVEIYDLTYNIFMLIKNKFTFFKASKGSLGIEDFSSKKMIIFWIFLKK